MEENQVNRTLETTGDEAFIKSTGLGIVLRWTEDVDLDLLAFYKAEDGRKGGIFSDNFPGGSLGTIEEFPYIKLSGDAGINGEGGINEEAMCIGKLEHMEEIYICAMNYTALEEEKEIAFSEYDGSILVMDDEGDAVIVPLDAKEKGNIAVIAKIDNSDPKGTKIINLNKIINLETFASIIPGAEILVTGE